MKINKYIKTSVLYAMYLSSFNSKLLGLKQSELFQNLELNKLTSNTIEPTSNKSVTFEPLSAKSIENRSEARVSESNSSILNESKSNEEESTKSESSESDFLESEIQTEPFVAKFVCEDLTEEDIKGSNLDGENANNEYVRPSDLKKLSVTYMGYDDKPHYGTLITANKFIHPDTGEIINIASDLLEIFKELYEAKFPIDYIGCFNFRLITNSNSLSDHALGLAVDINYEQNPYFKYDDDDENNKDRKVISTVPKDGALKYLDRRLEEKGIIKKDGVCVKIFKDHGWFWGGDWQNPKDYMHFQRFKAGWKKEKRYPLDQIQDLSRSQSKNE